MIRTEDGDKTREVEMGGFKGGGVAFEGEDRVFEDKDEILDGEDEPFEGGNCPFEGKDGLRNVEDRALEDKDEDSVFEISESISMVKFDLTIYQLM